MVAGAATGAAEAVAVAVIAAVAVAFVVAAVVVVGLAEPTVATGLLSAGFSQPRSEAVAIAVRRMKERSECMK